MSLAENFRMMAIYNQRMNNQLLSVCSKLTSEQLTQNTHAFFATIMDHWNHILFGDLIMLRRLVHSDIIKVDEVMLAKLPVATLVNDQFVANITELKTLRTLVDSVYINITKELTDACCNKQVRYTTTAGEKLNKNVGQFFQHIFNHQTHHRGQLTCLLSQLGIDYGCTDLPIVVASDV